MTENTTAAAADRLLTLRPDEGHTIWFLTNRITIKATAQSTGGAFGLFESHIPPGFSPPLHIHHREDESFWVLEGEVTFVCGDRTFRAGPGSFVFTPRDVPHTFRVEGSTPARMLTLITPGGGEQFFASVGRPAEGAGFPPPGPPDIARLKEIGTQFDMAIVGPPLSSVPR
jgi:mannose-6-phosphate isomerase-like protein (cupin superfamily)